MIKTAQRKQHGFTLVELLIVITIIGILATVVIAAINPLEQARKARDASRKADAAQLHRAITSYYIANGCYPWEGTAATCPINPGVTAIGVTKIDATSMAAVGSVTAFGGGRLLTGAGGELGASFVNRESIRSGNLFVTVAFATGISSVNICFEPESAIARSSLSSTLGTLRTSTNGAAGTVCNATAYNGGVSTGTCFICVP